MTALMAEGAPQRERLASLRAAAGGFALFACLAVAVASGASNAFDIRAMEVARSIATWAGVDSGWRREAIRDWTALGGASVLTASTIFATSYFVVSGRRRMAGLVLFSAAGATAASTVFKQVIDRARPGFMEQAIPTFTASFPSGHALLTAAIIMPLAVLIARAISDTRRGRLVIALALLIVFTVGLSRIALGVHWPSDVLAGWSFGLAWAAVTLRMAENARA
jgi:undecaprenyl-diphosphatase